MKYIIALPDKDYFVWQMLVQISNFNKYGYDKDLIYVIGKVDGELNKNLIKIMESDLNCEFYVYDDTRKNSYYPSSLRPHILSKFFKENPHYNNETFFYTDPDVVFTKKMNFDIFLNDETWYVSDTYSYISANYIKGKSPILFKEMCDIVGIDPKIIEDNDKESSGGAQYIMKNIDYHFWDKVYMDCEKLYIHMRDTSNKYNPKHPIQAWTSDMWAVLWNGMYFGNKVKCHKELDFSWASDRISKWDDTNIFHNAGVVNNDNGDFYKINYQVSPFYEDIEVKKNSASYNYLLEVLETEKKYKHLLF